MNSRQIRIMQRMQIRFVKKFAIVLESQMKEWQEREVTKELILKDLNKVIEGAKTL